MDEVTPGKDDTTFVYPAWLGHSYRPGPGPRRRDSSSGGVAARDGFASREQVVAAPSPSLCMMWILQSGKDERLE